MICSTIRR